ncbi:ATP-binding protein [Microvirga sp. G4-2]|uniref:ATP-binding protein n=1 Tax=Microvirga sp. G4-2 TaxID=3434467 RepID=UPI0040444769
MSQQIDAPLNIELLATKDNVDGHGTEIRGTVADHVNLTADKAREVLGSRFLTDPNFVVTVDGVRVTFDDIPPEFLSELQVPVAGLGTARVLVIDAQRSDRSTRQHGVAWHVNNRLVGECGWRGSDYERILDGRTSEAKRYTFIVFADFLSDAVLPDWSDFDASNPSWQKTRTVVQDHIRDALQEFNATRRAEIKAAVRERLEPEVSRLPALSRERWNAFVDQVVDTCPNIRNQELEQLAGILANLEQARSRYGLIDQLHGLPPGSLDILHDILTAWSLNLAKEALDEIGTRLKLIHELQDKLRDKNTDEVQELQPLFERGLWIFGPEFETIEFTSNRGMTEVIRHIFRGKVSGSLNRPDFVVVPDGSVGLYSRPAYDDEHNPNGVSSLVIVELKRPGIPIGHEQKQQAWKYVKELRDKGQIKAHTKVNCFVMGSEIDPLEADSTITGVVTITPLLYETFILRAEKRMLNLYRLLKDAPFLRANGVDAEEFVHPPLPAQTALGV